MMKQWSKLGFVGLVVFAGCASTLKDYDETSMKPEEGAIFGRFTVEYNGAEYTQNCAVCFKTPDGPCFKLSDHGYLLMKLTPGTQPFTRLACLDGEEKQVMFKDIQVKSIAGARSYVGAVHFKWTNSETGVQFSNVWNAIAGIKTQKRTDGTVTYEVKDELDAALHALSKKMPPSDQLKIEKNLMTSQVVPAAIPPAKNP